MLRSIYLGSRNWEWRHTRVDRVPVNKSENQDGRLVLPVDNNVLCCSLRIETLSTGKEVGQNRVYDWFYETQIDRSAKNSI